MRLHRMFEKIPWMAWVESTALTLVWIVCALYQGDPLTLHSVFPWVWFAPLLVALRYGLWPSQWSLLLILYVFIAVSGSDSFTMTVQLAVLGGFLLTVTGVVFQQCWSKKIKQYAEISEYLQTRIQTLAYSY